uniref:Uncharacterized protein n=1 Tax=Medicago truncatula TaxID=3880 RepID=B7FG34_MEDTR|nr:unknown [Medicago truncatula]
MHGSKSVVRKLAANICHYFTNKYKKYAV